MLKWLMIIAFVLGVLTIGGLAIGLTSQQPFLFGTAILCLSPLTAFFFGGGVFLLASAYTIEPKQRAVKGRGVGISRQQELG